MPKVERWMVCALLWVGLVLPVAGCKSGKSDEEKAVDAKTFRMALGSKPRSLDPGLMTDNQSGQIGFNAFEGLTAYPASSEEAIQPGVAKAWESADNKTWTFTLRDDAMWSNGDPVTAQDFEYAWRRVLDPKTGSEYAWIMTDAAMFKNASKFAAGEVGWEEVGVKAIDDHTLQVVSEAPVAYLPQLTAFFAFMPVHKATVEAHGNEWTRPENWVSNGPYVVSEIPHDKTYILKKNPKYWDKDSVAIETVEMRVLEDDASRIKEFDAGGIDWTGPGALPQKLIENLVTRDEFRQDVYLSVEYIQFNLREPMFQGEKGQKLRRAIALAIDRPDIVKNTLKGIGRPAKGFVPPLPDFDSKSELKTDEEQAKKLLAEAGYPGGQGLPTISYLYPSGNSNAEAVAEVIQNQLERKLGVKIELEKKEFKQVLNDQQQGNFQISRAGWIGDYDEPSTFLGMFTETSQQNNPKWINQTYDGLLDQAKRSTDPAKRGQLYAQAELLLEEQAPVTPLYYSEQTTLVKDNVEGFEPHILNVHLLKYLSKGSP